MKKLIILLGLVLCLGGCVVEVVEVPDIEVPDQNTLAEDYLANTSDEDILAYFTIATRLGNDDRFYFSSTAELQTIDLLFFYQIVSYYEDTKKFGSHIFQSSKLTIDEYSAVLDCYLSDYTLDPSQLPTDKNQYYFANDTTAYYDIDTDSIYIEALNTSLYNSLPSEEYQLGEINLLEDNKIEVELLHPNFTGVIVTAEVMEDGVKFISLQPREITLDENNDSTLALAFLDQYSEEDILDYLIAIGFTLQPYYFSDVSDISSEDLFIFILKMQDGLFISSITSDYQKLYQDQESHFYEFKADEIANLLDQYFIDYNYDFSAQDIINIFPSATLDETTNTISLWTGYGYSYTYTSGLNIQLLGDNLLQIEVTSENSSGDVVQAIITEDGIRLLSKVMR